MSLRWNRSKIAILGMLVLFAHSRAVTANDEAAIGEVRKSEERLTAAFNAGKADEVSAMFLPKSELIDEAGTVYQGPAEIKELIAAFFQRFPGAKLALNIETVRLVGPVAIEEGTRTMSTADGAEKSRFRYIAVWAKSDRGWQLASFRDFPDESAPTPGEHLKSLEWLVGDWVNEGADGKVEFSYHWSEDKNYLLGNFHIKNERGNRTSTQRIGWDPSVGVIRSWLFDTDGGFAEGVWTVVEDGVVVKSTSVNPDGETATATLNFYTKDKDHFTIKGTDRVVGDRLEEDFEITVTRRPPAAGK